MTVGYLLRYSSNSIPHIQNDGEEEEEEYPCLSATFQCGVQSEDRFISPRFFLQLLIAVALDRRPP
jgi:hypothetical protein